MLRSLYVLPLLVMGAIGVVACSSDDDDDPPATGGSGGSGGSAGKAGTGGSAGGGNPAAMTFFVTSQTNTGNLGGLSGADAICERLAAAVGAGGKDWRAYLSVDDDGAGQPVHARDRIGSGPWANAQGEVVATDVTALHTRTGNVDIFLDEKGAKINGQWGGSPSPNQHDVLTGSTSEGKLQVGQTEAQVGFSLTCKNWTSDTDDEGSRAQVGHTDGLGPNQDAAPPRNSWQSAHASRGCSQGALSMTGSAGRFYCFATKK
jgi:hypothetical protein